MIWLSESVESWDDKGLVFVIEQLARNTHVDQEAVERIRKWDIPSRKISNFYWQKLVDKLDDVRKIWEEMQRRNKEMMTRSSDFFKRVLGTDELNSIVITQDMLGREQLDEIKRELSSLKGTTMLGATCTLQHSGYNSY